jgi:predicted DCC family thiol-disulfide oxidoreductase YuxK
MSDSAKISTSRAVVLFDGVCNLCNASVNFIIKRDPRNRFAFAALQSEAGRALLARHDISGRRPDSVVLLEEGRCFTRSSAALRIARQLSGPWPLLYPLAVVPAPIRDRIYDWVARNRYRWFGKREQCRLPTPELASRFVLASDISLNG